jgi:hypothetical protein
MKNLLPEALYASGGSYGEWISAQSAEGVWTPKPMSASACCEEVVVALALEDRATVERHRSRYPNQFASDERWLPELVRCVARICCPKWARAAHALCAKVGYMLGDRVRHAERGVGTIVTFHDGEELTVRFDVGGEARVPFRTVTHV